MIDKPASIRLGGPVTPVRAKSGIAHECFGDQADQFLAIDGIHSAKIRRLEHKGNMRRLLSRVVAMRGEDRAGLSPGSRPVAVETSFVRS
jgi:hypothetical protein